MTQPTPARLEEIRKKIERHYLCKKIDDDDYIDDDHLRDLTELLAEIDALRFRANTQVTGYCLQCESLAKQNGWLEEERNGLKNDLQSQMKVNQMNHEGHCKLRDELRAKLDIAVKALELGLDFYHMDTLEWTQKYGSGMNTRDLGDNFRTALAKIDMK